MHQSNQEALIVIEGRATYERMMSAVCNTDPEEAIRQVQNFLKVYPDFAQAHNDIAVIFHRIGNNLKALAHYEKAHKLAPLSITFRKNLADFYAVELDWSDEAIHIYLDILKDNPFDVETLNALGTLNEQNGRKEQARQFYTRALQLDPLSINARNALHSIGGTAALEQLSAGSSAGASSHGGILLEGAPVFESAPSAEEIYGEATEAANAGRTGEAITLLEKLIRHYPDEAIAHNDLGVLYQQAGDRDRSRRHHEAAVRLFPGDVTFQKNLADLLAVCFNEYENALKIYITLLGKHPRDLDLLKGIAFICLETGKTADAETFLQRMLAIEPWNAEARQMLLQLEESAKAAVPAKSAEEMHAEAVSLAGEGRDPEAMNILEQLVSQHPAHAVAFNDLGVVRFRNNDPDGARKAYERAVELEPANPVFRRNLADLYFAALGMTDEAIRIYLDLHRQNPRDLETLVNLGHICAAMERPEEAKTFYRRALEIEPWNSEARTAMKQI